MKGTFGERIIYDMEKYEFEPIKALPVIESAHMNSHSLSYEEASRLLMNVEGQLDYENMEPDQWYKCSCRLEGTNEPQYLVRRAVPITVPVNRETGKTVYEEWKA